MFGCYRRDEAADPETYVGAVVMVLSRYEADVIAYVTDPFTGLPGRIPFLPNLYEVKLACEERAAELARTERFRNWGRGGGSDGAPVVALPREERPTLVELEERLGRRIG